MKLKAVIHQYRGPFDKDPNLSTSWLDVWVKIKGRWPWSRCRTLVGTIQTVRCLEEDNPLDERVGEDKWISDEIDKAKSGFISIYGVVAWPGKDPSVDHHITVNCDQLDRAKIEFAVGALLLRSGYQAKMVWAPCDGYVDEL